MSSRGIRKKLVTTGTKTGGLAEQRQKRMLPPPSHTASHQQRPFIKCILRVVAPKTTCLDPSSLAPQCWEMCKIQSKSICSCPSFQWSPKPNLGLCLSFKRNWCQEQAFLRCSFPHLLNSSPKSFFPEQCSRKPGLSFHKTPLPNLSFFLTSTRNDTPSLLWFFSFLSISYAHSLLLRSARCPKKALCTRWCLLLGSLCIPTATSEVSAIKKE